MKNKFSNILFSFLLFIIVLEILFRMFGIFSTYNEKIGNAYSKKYKISNSTWFHVWQANNTVDYNQKEFRYQNKYNELGHREKNFSLFEQDTSSLKIACIGDSFTEGDGATSDSTWVNQLERRLNKDTNTKYSIYNAGVCGSDVFYDFTMLKEKLITAKPSIVIECINSSDIFDVIYRGGKERFNSDGTMSAKSGPNWEKLYEMSYFFRFITRTIGGYNSNLIKRKFEKAKKIEALNLIEKQYIETAIFCKLNNIKYVLILLPTPADIINDNKNEYLLKNKVKNINLFPILKKHFNNKNIANYSWKFNGHYNGKGSLKIGDIIFKELIDNNIILPKKNRLYVDNGG